MPEPDRIIRLKTVLDRAGLSRSPLYRKIGGRRLSPPDTDQHPRAGWHESAVNRWIADPVSYRDASAEQ